MWGPDDPTEEEGEPRKNEGIQPGNQEEWGTHSGAVLKVGMEALDSAPFG